MQAISHSPIHRNTEQAHIALQGLPTNSSYRPIPGDLHTDREMLTRSQIAHHYRKSIVGKANIDINKPVLQNAAAQPRLVQKEKQTFDFFGPINTGIGSFYKAVDKVIGGIGPMLVNGDISANEQLTRCYYTPSIAWLQVTADDYRLSVKLVGDISPASNCIGDVPVFIDAEPGLASKLLPDYRVNSRQVSVLDFTASSAVSTQCNTTAALNCVVPEKASDSSRQIDSVLATGDDAYIYLSKEQMDNWLASKKPGKETDSLRYIRISPKKNEGMPRETLGGIISASIIGTGLLMVGGMFLRARCRPSDAAANTETTVDITNVAKASSSVSSPDASSEV